MQYIERLVQEAVKEWQFFNKGASLETDFLQSDRIGEMWSAIGYAGVTGNDTRMPWSAAFISWILKNAGYKNTEFSLRHSTYIHQAINNRFARDRNADFWCYDFREIKPEVGDIVCQWRKIKIDYDYAKSHDKFASHTDVVVDMDSQAIETLGGNVKNSVNISRFALDSRGFLKDNGKLFAIMKNQHRV